MSPPIVKRVAIPKPESFLLAGSPLQIGSQLAESLLRPALRGAIDALPEASREDLLTGVQMELTTVSAMTLGRGRTVAMLRDMANMVERMPDDVAAAAGVPADPEVH